MGRRKAEAAKCGARLPAATKAALASDFLPYRALVDEHALLLLDGSVMLSLAVPVLALGTTDPDQLCAHSAMHEAMSHIMSDARFVFYHHVIRRRVVPDLDGGGSDPVSRYIDARWRTHMAAETLYINEQFITLIRRPARRKANWVNRILQVLKGGAPEPHVEPEDLDALREAGQAMLVSLAPYGARLLSDYEGAGGSYSEVLELLSSLYNGEMRPVRRPAPSVPIGDMLPYRSTYFGLDAMEFRGAGDPDFAAILSLKNYPDSAAPGLTDGLLRVPCELVVTESFAPSGSGGARERDGLHIGRFRSSAGEALPDKRKSGKAHRSMGMGTADFGEHHFSVLVRDKSLPRLDRQIAACASALADVGAIAVREDVDLQQCFWAQLPGNEALIVRRAAISRAGLSCFGSLHGVAVGQATGNHWGEAVTVLPTASTTPFFFNFHSGALGNFMLIGSSGSGREVVMNFLLAQAQKFKPRMVIFDRNCRAQVFLPGIGGDYNRVAAGQTIGFNPLEMPDTQVNRAFLQDWLGLLLDVQGPGEKASIAAALDASYARDPSLRRLGHFRDLLPGAHASNASDLASRLDAWSGVGEHAWLFDNGHDGLDLSQRIMGFDMTALFETPRLLTLAMMYLLHRIDQELDGTPAMILIDDGWEAMENEVFASHFVGWLKTLSTRNALVGFLSKSAADALGSSIFPALAERIATMIFMPDSRLRAADYRDGFGLTEQECQAIQKLPARAGFFLVRQAGASVAVRLDLSAMPEVETILSRHEITAPTVDNLRMIFGETPERWYPMWTGHAWPNQESSDPEGQTFNQVWAAE